MHDDFALVDPVLAGLVLAGLVLACPKNFGHHHMRGLEIHESNRLTAPSFHDVASYTRSFDVAAVSATWLNLLMTTAFFADATISPK